MSYTVRFVKINENGEDADIFGSNPEEEYVPDVNLIFGHTLVPDLKMTFEVSMSYCRKDICKSLEDFLALISLGKTDRSHLICSINDSGNSHVFIEYDFDKLAYTFRTGTNSGKIWGMSNFEIKFDAYPILMTVLEYVRYTNIVIICYIITFYFIYVTCILLLRKDNSINN